MFTFSTVMKKNGWASTRPKLAILWRHGSVALATTGSGYFWAGCENHSPTSVFNHNSSSHLKAPWRCVEGTGSGSKAQLASTWTGRSNWEWRADVRTSHLHRLHLKRPNRRRNPWSHPWCGETTWWLRGGCKTLIQSDLHLDTRSLCSRPSLWPQTWRCWSSSSQLTTCQQGF